MISSLGELYLNRCTILPENLLHMYAMRSALKLSLLRSSWEEPWPTLVDCFVLRSSQCQQTCPSNWLLFRRIQTQNCCDINIVCHSSSE